MEAIIWQWCVVCSTEFELNCCVFITSIWIGKLCSCSLLFFQFFFFFYFYFVIYIYNNVYILDFALLLLLFLNDFYRFLSSDCFHVMPPFICCKFCIISVSVWFNFFSILSYLFIFEHKIGFDLLLFGCLFNCTKTK